LRDLANKQAAQDVAAIAQGESEAATAKDGDALLAIGYNYVINGKAERGLALMEQGLSMSAEAPGGWQSCSGAGVRTDRAEGQGGAAAANRAGNDGVADLARLWLLQTNRGAAAS